MLLNENKQGLLYKNSNLGPVVQGDYCAQFAPMGKLVSYVGNAQKLPQRPLTQQKSRTVKKTVGMDLRPETEGSEQGSTLHLPQQNSDLNFRMKRVVKGELFAIPSELKSLTAQKQRTQAKLKSKFTQSTFLS